MNDSNFKNTETGKIPSDWEEVRVGERISLEYGKGLTESERKNGEYSVFGSNGIVGYHNDFLVRGPGIVVGRKGTIGAINWSEDNFWPIDTTYFVKVIGNDIDLRWLYYKLTALNLSKLNMATGTPGLNRDLVYTQVTPFPSLPEQKIIAEILSTVDQAIEKVDEAIKKTQRLKNGLMQELLTKGIGHKEFKDTEIGRIPKDWSLVRLEEAVKSIKRGPFGGSVKKEIFVSKGYKVYEQKNVINNDFSSGSYYIDSKKYNELKIFAIKEGDILLTGAGTIGKIAVVPEYFEPGIINQALIKITLDQNKTLIPYFYNLLIFAPFSKKVLGSSHGATMKNISSVKDLKSILIPLPPQLEQQKISEILSGVERRLELLRERKERLERVKKGLMGDLLTGKRRVRLEV
jgi:type I restriction enzyme S subunit